MATLAGIGVDAGSTTCKVVAIDSAGKILDFRLAPADPRVADQVNRLVEDLGKHKQVPLAATGYGRKLIRTADLNTTEITCHARGVFEELGRPGTLVDIGGQDTKVIRIGPQGKPVDFVMNDKCAAGTGRFLEHTAARLNVPIDELGPVALSTQNEEAISSTCTVFAESEVISLIAHGAELEAIVRGLHRSLVSRVYAMVRNLGLTTPLMLSGGVANNSAIRQMLSDVCGHEVSLPRHPQLMGAYGAALIAVARA
ncbi:MAG: 2-hydroxyglutaryl-CoA dehydratase [Proteobacteria bacterium]|jgi:(R)-2-hydroxyacyl-CoA dehydratese activating ATPase|nr:2-hydroxyglutaryl-CoA dehydratase [Pseudomonadota bacterium]